MRKRSSNYPKLAEKYVRSELKKISGTIQKHRKELGLTQESFAEKLDISVTTVRFIEQGRRVPSVELLIYILRELNLEIDIQSRS